MPAHLPTCIKRVYLMPLVLALALIACQPGALATQQPQATPTRAATALPPTGTPAPIPTQTPTPIPTSTATETPIPSPTPTLLPAVVQAEEWRGMALQSVCLTYHQSGYEGAPALPIPDILRLLLPRLGVQVMEAGDACEATLALDMSVNGILGDYQGGSSCWTGASAFLDARLTAAGRSDLEVVGDYTYSPAQIIMDCPSSESQSPFDEAWGPALFAGLSEIWGETMFIQAWDMPDVDESIRRSTTWMEWDVQPEAELLPALERALQSHDPIAREGAARALGVMAWSSDDPSRLAPLLVQAWQDPEAVVRSAVVDSVGSFEEHTTSELLQVLAEALSDPDSDVQFRATLVLWSLADYKDNYSPEDVAMLGQALVTMLQERKFGMNPMVMGVLGRWQVMEAVPLLIELLSDPTSMIQMQASTALEEITGEDFGSDAQAWQSWWDAQDH